MDYTPLGIQAAQDDTKVCLAPLPFLSSPTEDGNVVKEKCGSQLEKTETLLAVEMSTGLPKDSLVSCRMN